MKHAKQHTKSENRQGAQQARNIAHNWGTRPFSRGDHAEVARPNPPPSPELPNGSSAQKSQLEVAIACDFSIAP